VGRTDDLAVRRQKASKPAARDLRDLDSGTDSSGADGADHDHKTGPKSPHNDRRRRCDEHPQLERAAPGSNATNDLAWIDERHE
jgi:hypothetical protein